ncbi:anti-sigma factor antagonist [Candidatus Uabimicrobium amorphum]|uniref:Anti-sigma factor antagonist n=1 Tax=Uabimicrobium amorphum TaxID=2596890 RepID=A0A5S9ILV4_UABAM|nr:anti-sigma factor antagonist [Candidatus Uabimicrobium amorphum]BBM84283.1 anti-sigma factor antagonist [Candidatus Uabimicrobium amorphum]
MSTLEMNTDFPNIRKTVTFRAKGQIDHKTVPLFREKLNELLSSGYTRFIMDMTAVSFINSVALGTLVNFADELESKNGGVVFFDLPPRIKIVFSMLELDSFFNIFPTQAEAINYLRSFVTQCHQNSLLHDSENTIYLSGTTAIPKLKKQFNRFVLQRKWNKAIVAIDKLLKLDNKNTHFLIKKASLFIKLKNYRKAKEILKSVIHENPHDPSANKLLMKLENM